MVVNYAINALDSNAPDRDAAEAVMIQAKLQGAYNQMTPEQQKWFVIGALTQALTSQHAEMPPHRSIFSI